MNWKDLLQTEIESAYKGAELLIGMVEDSRLDWKPATGQNWMTTGQLLMHITNACGAPIKGFVTGDWGMPEGMDVKDLKPEEMLPSAEKMPTIGSVAEAKKLLAEDKQTAMDMLARCAEDDLANKPTPAPWDNTSPVLGYRVHQMIHHLHIHKAQLFYYLKLQGQNVNTMHLWAM
ncbi:MAG: DinB family protein [bacterium]